MGEPGIRKGGSSEEAQKIEMDIARMLIFHLSSLLTQREAGREVSQQKHRSVTQY